MSGIEEKYTFLHLSICRNTFVHIKLEEEKEREQAIIINHVIPANAL